VLVILIFRPSTVRVVVMVVHRRFEGLEKVAVGVQYKISMLARPDNVHYYKKRLNLQYISIEEESNN
jgi:hypothetical protein